jgi:hypothetical protein
VAQLATEPEATPLEKEIEKEFQNTSFVLLSGVHAAAETRRKLRRPWLEFAIFSGSLGIQVK